MEDWIPRGVYSYYFNHTSRLEYIEAEKDCEERGAYLASIVSDEEQNFLACKCLYLNIEYIQNIYIYIWLNQSKILKAIKCIILEKGITYVNVGFALV